MELSEQYSKYSGVLADLIKAQAEYFNSHRGDFKSDTATDRAFEVTPDGVKLTVVKIKLKSLEKQMASIKTMIDVLTEEAKGLY